MYTSDPEHLFLKWAFKAGAIDADQLLEFNRRTAEERPGEYLMDLLVEWEYLTREAMAALLEPAELDRGVADGLIPRALADQISGLEVPR